MKKIKIIIALLVLNTTYFAQKVNYKIIKDDPSPNSKLNLNLDLFQMDFNSVIEASSFNVGVWGTYGIVGDRIHADVSLRKSWMALGRLGEQGYPGHTEINVGGDIMLTSTSKIHDTKVVLDVKEKGTTYKNGNTYDVSEVTYLTLPATYSIKIGFRGGLYYKSNAYEYDSDDLGVNILRRYGGKMTSSGIYGGIIRKKAHTLVITTDNYGQKSSSIGTDFYIDAMVVPVNKFMDIKSGSAENPVDETGYIKDKLGNNPFGFRVGFKGYQIAPKSDTDKKFGMSYSFEGGVKPYLGIYFNCGIGITIVK